MHKVLRTLIAAGGLALSMGSATTVQADPAAEAPLIAELVTANHILADQNVVDGFGHISVRSETNRRP